jgi:hypothetical protein
MKTIIKGIISETIITPIPLKNFSFSFAADINIPIIEMKKITPEIKNIQPYKSTIIMYRVFDIVRFKIKYLLCYKYIVDNFENTVGLYFNNSPLME